MGQMAILLHAMLCTLAKLDRDMRLHAGNGAADLEFQRDKAGAMYFFDLAELEIEELRTQLYQNADETMLAAAAAAQKLSDSQSNEQFIIPEKTPTPARGTGRKSKQDGIKQFPGEPYCGEKSEWHTRTWEKAKVGS
jgi:hypothetical protein